MHCNVASRAVDQYAAQPVVDRGCRAAQFQFRAGPAAIPTRIVAAKRQRVRNTIVRRADDATDRLRAVAQGRRSPDHLDLVGRERHDRHEMVFAEIGHSASADSVLDDANAIHIQPADDRPRRGAGRKA